MNTDKIEEFIQTQKSKVLELTSKYPEKKSLEIDFKELDFFDGELADGLLEKPDEFIKEFEKQLKVETGFKVHSRFYNLPDMVDIDVQKLGEEHLNKLVKVDGVISWITEISPRVKTAVWECLYCGKKQDVETDRVSALKPPNQCSECGRNKFKLLENESEFINVQRAKMQDLIEKLQGSMPTSTITMWMEDDLVNTIFPGEKITVTGILRIMPPKEGKGKSSVYGKYFEVVHLHKVMQEFEEINISKEDEKKIKELSENPKLYEMIIQSIAPGIYGYTELKSAIALQLFGGAPNKTLPDGQKIRSDIHILLIGDPGCIIGDERIALGNGAIVKIQNLGARHLQEINTPVLTGQGYKRAVATVFHRYESQPIIEIVTESGKSVKGTYNHPLLVVEGMERKWKRLDEIKKNYRVAVTTQIPCSIRKLQPTGWIALKRRFGPKSKAIIPEKLSPSLSGLLGYLVGDGWVTRTRFAFDVNPEEKDLLKPLSKIIEKEFKLKPHVIERKSKGKKPIFVVQVDEVDVAYNLSFLKEKRIPDIVMRSGNRVVSEFLSWLFEADGCVFSKGRGRRAVQLKSANIELLRDVQTMLLRFGIHSRIVERNLTIRRAQSIRKYYKFIGFKSEKKRRKLYQLVRDVKCLQHEFGNQLSERVVSARRAGVADVFDVEVPGAKRFISNGVISHNTAKSSILQYVSRLAPKCVLVSGKGASGVGLTASAEKDDVTGGWILKAGAMVLASGGQVNIDELDKMDKEDRSALHESMEQQQINIAKAGIVAQFNTRTSVLAAANPKFGRFDPNEPPTTQFDIPPTLLSRFDLIFTIKDILDESRDRKMAEHILLVHSSTANEVITPLISLNDLRKYIAYARRTCFPELSREAGEKIKEYYVSLRKMGKKENTFPITARQIEGIIRLAEASAKIRLSSEVGLVDAEKAISLTDFVLKDVFTDKETGLIDSDIVNIGQSKSKIDKVRSVINIIQSIESQVDMVDIDEIIRKASEIGLDEMSCRKIIKDLSLQGELYEPKTGFVKSARKRIE
ncbi:MAG: ATP-binding protein [Candidatus Marsarchaeota archaeon]|nr:ATP-binding protein [Candidatus Marsarchaeota archaeon]